MEVRTCIERSPSAWRARWRSSWSGWPAVAAPKLIGYVFAGTYAQTSSGLVGSIETLGVRTDYTLAPEGEVTVPGPYIVGLGLVHTPSGISLYAQDSTTAIY